MKEQNNLNLFIEAQRQYRKGFVRRVSVHKSKKDYCRKQKHKKKEYDY